MEPLQKKFGIKTDFIVNMKNGWMKRKGKK